MIPVYNEERDLPGSVRRLHQLSGHRGALPVANHDGRQRQHRQHPGGGATSWPSELPDVDVIHLDAKGRGGALRAAWMASEADVVAYMDVDLSTDLSALMPLVAPLISGHSDVAIGSRLAASSRVVRGRSANSSLAVTT